MVHELSCGNGFLPGSMRTDLVHLGRHSLSFRTERQIFTIFLRAWGRGQCLRDLPPRWGFRAHPKLQSIREALEFGWAVGGLHLSFHKLLTDT